MEGKCEMNMPGFTAAASLYKMSGGYPLAETRACGGRTQDVIAQLAVGRFPGAHGGGGFGIFGGLWCKLGCEIAYSVCLDGCEGTLDNPKPSLNCVFCDQAYRACLQGCD
jgi:hypothetical protein